MCKNLAKCFIFVLAFAFLVLCTRPFIWKMTATRQNMVWKVYVENLHGSDKLSEILTKVNSPTAIGNVNMILWIFDSKQVTITSHCSWWIFRKKLLPTLGIQAEKTTKRPKNDKAKEGIIYEMTWSSLTHLRVHIDCKLVKKCHILSKFPRLDHNEIYCENHQHFKMQTLCLHHFSAFRFWKQ